MKVKQKYYSMKEKLENTYYMLELTNGGEIATARLLGERDGKKLMFLAIMNKPTPNSEERLSYSVQFYDNEEFDEIFASANDMIETSKKYVFEKGDQKHTIFLSNLLLSGFFKAVRNDGIVYSIYLGDKYEKYENSKDIVKEESTPDPILAKDYVLKNINYMQIFEDKLVNDMLLTLYNLATKQSSSKTITAETAKRSLEIILDVLKTNDYAMVKEIMDSNFYIIAEQPYAVQLATAYCFENYKKTINVDAFNKQEIMNLPFEDKKLLMQAYVEDGLKEQRYNNPTNLNNEGTEELQDEMQNVLDEATFEIYYGLQIIQEKLGIIEKGEDAILEDINKIETGRSQTAAEPEVSNDYSSYQDDGKNYVC